MSLCFDKKYKQRYPSSRKSSIFCPLKTFNLKRRIIAKNLSTKSIASVVGQFMPFEDLVDPTFMKVWKYLNLIYFETKPTNKKCQVFDEKAGTCIIDIFKLREGHRRWKNKMIIKYKNFSIVLNVDILVFR